jgi:hypothetical protein
MPTFYSVRLAPKASGFNRATLAIEAAAMSAPALPELGMRPSWRTFINFVSLDRFTLITPIARNISTA